MAFPLAGVAVTTFVEVTTGLAVSVGAASREPQPARVPVRITAAHAAAHPTHFMPCTTFPDTISYLRES